jgi:hypothetical protein
VSDHFLINDPNIQNDFTCEPLSNDPASIKSIIDHTKRNKYTFVPKKNQDQIYKRKVVGVIGAASSSVIYILILLKFNSFFSFKKIQFKGFNTSSKFFSTFSSASNKLCID